MGDIVIKSGLEEPYSIPYTDPDKEQSLRNLLIAKFAFLGSEAGVQLKTQTLEMQKVVDSVNYVNDLLDKIKTPLVWSDKEGLTLNIDDQIKADPFVSSSSFDLDKLSANTKLLNNAGLEFGGSTNYFISTILETPNYSQILTNTSIKKISNLTEASALSEINEYQIFTFSNIDDPAALFFLYRNNTYIAITHPVSFVIPQSKDEINIWKEYPSILQAFNNTKDFLRNETVLYNPGGDNPDPLSIIDAKININANFAMVKDLMGGAVPYAFKKVSPNDKFIQDIHTVFTLTDDKNNPPTYYFSAENGLVNELNLPTYSVTPFIYKPTADDIQSWRSQFSEKQIQLSQKSATLQNFLNEIIAIYNYTFEAATNLLRAHTSLLSEISRNL